MITGPKDRPRVPGTIGAWSVFCLFVALFFTSTCRASALSLSDDGYLEGLIEKAKVERLYETSAWQSLIHYERTYSGGYKSLMDDRLFFLSPAGKKDPASELEATIRAIFSTGPKVQAEVNAQNPDSASIASSAASTDDHPQCRYPARTKWLKRVLSIDPVRLPSIDCKAYRELVEGLSPRSVVLVFPVAYMNSPASMFGHTLLRIDSASESKLNSYAVNYSAFTNETNGALFAVKGIFGFYEGRFSMLPYYEKIKEYGSLESRDMWEYALNLTADEVDTVVAHMWELKDRFSYYYFFDENCAFNLLKAMEAGRPGSELTERLSAWVIPLETIRALKEAGLFTGERIFRPSKTSRIKAMEATLEAGHRHTAEMIAFGTGDPESVSGDSAMDTETKIRTLDLAVEYIQYRFLRKETDRKTYLESYIKVLGLRSNLGKGVDYAVAEPQAPEAGHGPLRLSVGGGFFRGDGFTSLGIRPANHDLMDQDEGYLKGAGISFLDAELRFGHKADRLSLQRLLIVEINSISERSDFFKPVSWRFRAGLERQEIALDDHRSDMVFSGGPGLSYAVPGDGLVYAFIEPDVRFGSGLEDGYAIGAGLSVGVLRPITQRWKAGLEASAATFALGEKYSTSSVTLKQRYSIDRSNAITLDIKRSRLDGYLSTEVSALLRRYY